MTKVNITDREKQSTVLPTEADPATSFTKASQAILRALGEIKATRKGSAQDKKK